MSQKPAWYKGQMRKCEICGFEYPERDYRIRIRDGKYVCKWDYDSLTELERVQQINGRLR